MYAPVVLTWFTVFSFCPDIPPIPSLSSPCFRSSRTVIPLYSPTCFTHTHTCSLSLTELHFGPERELLMKRNRSFFNHTLLWSHLFTLIFTPPSSYFLPRICTGLIADVPFMYIIAIISYSKQSRTKIQSHRLLGLVVVFGL